MGNFPLDFAIIAFFFFIIVVVVVGRETGQNRNIHFLQTEDKRKTKEREV